MAPTRSDVSQEAELSASDEAAARLFAEAVGIMDRLRSECPWDREQTFDSIRKHTLEETYEVLDAIERREWPHLAEELGDLMLQVLFYARMGTELGEQSFSIEDVLEGLNQKLVRRHPHVFGAEASAMAGNQAGLKTLGQEADGTVASAEQVVANWEAIKVAEKMGRAETAALAEQSGIAGAEASLLDGVLRAQPALAEAAKLGSKAAKVGFDWPEWRPVLDKLQEEVGELVVEAEAVKGDPGRQAAVEAELGDLLFTVAHLGRHLGVDPETALRGSNLRFRERFQTMEAVAAKPLDAMTPDELEALWRQAKSKLAGKAAL